MSAVNPRRKDLPSLHGVGPLREFVGFEASSSGSDVVTSAIDNPWAVRAPHFKVLDSLVRAARDSAQPRDITSDNFAAQLERALATLDASTDSADGVTREDIE